MYTCTCDRPLFVAYLGDPHRIKSAGHEHRLVQQVWYQNLMILELYNYVLVVLQLRVLLILKWKENTIIVKTFLKGFQ